MQLEHSFTVPVGVEDAWTVLLDIERIAPCLPGAAIDSVDGDDFTGTVKVKLGPIAITYKGKASFVEKDVVTHRAVIDARGRESRGNGTANAKITATLTQDGASTTVDVVTDLDITGKPAQFGRGVMVDVGNKLIGQFADCLAGKLAGGTDAGAEPSAASGVDSGLVEPAPTEPTELSGGGQDALRAEQNGSPAVPSTAASVTPAAPATPPRPTRSAPPAEVAPINLIESAGPAVAKRLLPVIGAALVLLFFVLRQRRSS